ncbi:hypothetical protein BT67DRAFT_437064 [Trichocladium antarcticum]|uniref:Uncharacterized protein n=1 Tax=Trichocladium antarcticum TaxID=1450529 RepID=A0AAN6UCB4_9PEZI|nr:hypothetical protein BT67DRAFT_437064 [Trichocladium antarcticum]
MGFGRSEHYTYIACIGEGWIRNNNPYILTKVPKAKAPKRVAKPKAIASASKAKTLATTSETLAATSEALAAKAKRRASTSKTPAAKTKTLAASSKTPIAATNTKATIKTKASTSNTSEAIVIDDNDLDLLLTSYLDNSDFYAKDKISKPPTSAAKTYKKIVSSDPNEIPSPVSKAKSRR